MSDKLQSGLKNTEDNGADKAKVAGDWVAEKVENTKVAATGLLDKVQERAKNVTHSVADTAEQAVEKTGAWIGDAVNAVETAVSDGYHTTEHAMETFGKDVTELVKKYPIAAVAVGLGLGMLLGRATSNRA